MGVMDGCWMRIASTFSERGWLKSQNCNSDNKKAQNRQFTTSVQNQSVLLDAYTVIDSVRAVHIKRTGIYAFAQSRSLQVARHEN